MKKLTAEEFLKSKSYNTDHAGDLKDGLWTNGVLDDMIEFAKLHVEAALKAVSEKADVEYIEPDGCATGDYYEIDKDSILNSYPLANIK